MNWILDNGLSFLIVLFYRAALRNSYFLIFFSVLLEFDFVFIFIFIATGSRIWFQTSRIFDSSVSSRHGRWNYTFWILSSRAADETLFANSWSGELSSELSRQTFYSLSIFLLISVYFCLFLLFPSLSNFQSALLVYFIDLSGIVVHTARLYCLYCSSAQSVVRYLTHKEIGCLFARLGWLNVINPHKMDGFYALDLARWEERQVSIGSV